MSLENLENNFNKAGIQPAFDAITRFWSQSRHASYRVKIAARATSSFPPLEIKPNIWTIDCNMFASPIDLRTELDCCDNFSNNLENY